MQKKILGWSGSSVIQHLPGICKDLNLVPNISRRKLEVLTTLSFVLFHILPLRGFLEITALALTCLGHRKSPEAHCHEPQCEPCWFEVNHFLPKKANWFLMRDGVTHPVHPVCVVQD